jgi:chemotaxis protein CheC
MRKDTNIEDLELSELHLDALGEICNIGMGHAATALNQMIGKTINLSIPKIFVSSISETPEMVGGSEQVVAGIHLKVWGDIQGNILLIFPRDSARAICTLLTGGEPDNELILSEMHASALREVGNILASSYLSAMERLLGKSLFPSVPNVAFDMAGAIIEYVLAQISEEADRILVVEAAFSVEDESLSGHFFLLSDFKSLRIILESAKVLASEGQPGQ